MAEVQRRGLERRAAASGSSFDVLERRRAERRMGVSGGLDLLLPHKYHVVGAPNHLTYGQGLAQLRRADDGSGVQPYHDCKPCAFTFAENMRARLESDDALLWDTYLNSCTGVLYKRETGEFKIIGRSEDLLALPEDFNKAYWPLAFDSVEAQEIFRPGQHACNQVLTPAQAREHRPWLAAAGYDQKLLNDYVEKAEAKAREKGNNLEDYFMNFWMVEKPREDQLRSLVLDDADGSLAGGGHFLSSLGRFARVGLP